MDLLTIARVVLRRWYVSLPLIIATGVFAFMLQGNVPSQHYTNGSLLISDSQFDPTRIPDPVAIMDEAMLAVTESGELDAIGGGGTNLNIAPIGEATVEVAATADSATAAERSVRDGLALLEENVARLKVVDEDSVNSLVETQLLTPAVVAEAVAGGRFRAAGSVRAIDPTLDMVNPYPAGGSTVRVLQVAAMSDAGAARVTELTGTEISYTITSEPHDAAPIMAVGIRGPDPAAVLLGFDAIKQVMTEELTDRQDRAGVLPLRRLTIETLAQPQSVVDESPPLNRLVAVVAALGLVTAVGLALAAESLAQGRRRPRVGPPASGSGSEANEWRTAADSEPEAAPVAGDRERRDEQNQPSQAAPKRGWLTRSGSQG